MQVENYFNWITGKARINDRGGGQNKRRGNTSGMGKVYLNCKVNIGMGELLPEVREI